MGSLIGVTGLRYVHAFSNGQRGYYVRLPCPIKIGRAITKDFSSQSIPLRTLRKTAREWRDSTYFSLYGHKIPTRIVHRKQSNNRATAIPGVRRDTKTQKHKVGEKIYIYRVTYYIAEVWLESGSNGQRPRKSRSKIFSVRKYGEDKALELAIEWRKEMERRMLIDGPEKFEIWWKTVARNVAQRVEAQDLPSAL